MHRRRFLQSLGAAAARAAQSPRPLNFIFILIDDMGWTDLGCYGSKSYDTPDIDRLASQGMRFTNAYAACPVCSPTRASILTGKYPARLHLTDWIPGRKQWPTAKLLTPDFRQELPLEEMTIPEALKRSGYASASIGKWHLGGEGFSPTEQGFDRNVGGTARGSPKSYFGPFDLPGLKGGPQAEYLTDRLSAEAEKFIEENRDRPFFLYLPEFAVHLPLEGKKDLVAKYEAKLKSSETQNNPIYAAMVESVDQGVGRLLRKLDDLKIADRTVVILTSDNGGLRYEGKQTEPVTSNAPLRAGKGHLYEGGIREPLIVRWPGVVKAGSVCDDPMVSVDYFPTILEMAGLGKPKHPVDGVSLMPLLTQKGRLQRDARYWHV
jgi:arylsulfatase A